MDALWLFAYGLVTLAVKATVALYILFKMLRFANRSIGVTMEEVVAKLNEDPRALADYYGRRLIAAAIVILGISLGSAF